MTWDLNSSRLNANMYPMLHHPSTLNTIYEQVRWASVFWAAVAVNGVKVLDKSSSSKISVEQAAVHLQLLSQRTTCSTMKSSVLLKLAKLN
jgi:hypothetical protein